jgi:hypothetical protein
MRKIGVLTIGTLMAAAFAFAQTAPNELQGAWTGEVACMHGGGDSVTISIAPDARGQLTGSSNWGLARSDGRKGPQVPFTRLTVNGRSLTARGSANGHSGTLEAVVRGATMRGRWRIDGVDDVWTFVARRSDRAPQQR